MISNNIKKIGNYTFYYVQDLAPDHKPDGTIITYSPQNLYKNRKGLPLLQEAKNNAEFCRFRLKNVDASSGVYAWVVNEEIIYIGETRNFKTRFNSGYGNISPRNCYKGGQKTNCKMNKIVLEYTKKGQPIQLYFLKTDNYKDIELELIQQYSPLYNEKNNIKTSQFQRNNHKI